MSFVVWAVALALLLPFGTSAPHVGVACLGFFALCLLVGSACLPLRFQRSLVEEEMPWSGGLSHWALTAALGLSLCIVVWGVSAAFTHSLVLGHMILLALAFVGLLYWVATRRVWLAALEAPGLHLFVALVWVIAYYIYGFNEVTVRPGVYTYSYTYDVDYHLRYAGLMRAHGFPGVDFTGAKGATIATLYHWGAMVLLGGVQGLFQLSPFQAFRVVCLFCLSLLCLSTLSLVARAPVSMRIKYLAALSPFCYGGLRIFHSLLLHKHFGVLSSPALYSSTYSRGWLISGAAYHNVTQLVSLALAAPALLALQRHFRVQSYGALLLCGWLLAVSTNAKLSTGAVLFPAMILALLWGRQGWRTLLLVGSMAGLAFLMYAWPKWFLALPTSLNTWKMTFSSVFQWRNYTFVANVAAGIVFSFVVAFVSLLIRGWKRGPLLVRDVLFFALCGSLLLYFGLKEVGRPMHANQSWALYGMLSLWAPWALVMAASWWSRRPEGEPLLKVILVRVVALGASLGVVFHMVGGGLYLLVYPHLTRRTIPKLLVQNIERVGQKLPPRARLIVDPSLTHRSVLRAYIRHRMFFSYPTDTKVSRREWSALRNAFFHHYPRSARLMRLLKHRQAALVGPCFRPLAPTLRALGWRPIHVFWMKLPKTRRLCRGVIPQPTRRKRCPRGRRSCRRKRRRRRRVKHWNRRPRRLKRWTTIVLWADPEAY